MSHVCSVFLLVHLVTFHFLVTFAFGDFTIFGLSEELTELNLDIETDRLKDGIWNKNFGTDSFHYVSKCTKIYAYTSETGGNYTEIVYRNMSTFYESYFDVNKTTKILIHGWRGSSFSTFETELRTTYQSTQDVNILSVDWSDYASELYTFARDAVLPVGKYLAEVLDWLATEAGVSVGSIHVIGHSLGAHVAGTVGEHIVSGELGRITGLDPAGPGFTSSKSGRLDSSDAQFVDVIHTCGRWAGYFDPCGHVDFYPNNGCPPQPGCDFGSIMVCSHIRSHVLFNESVSSERFESTPCGSWKEYREGRCDLNATAVMGEHVDTSARGTFYLHTAGSYPFAVGNQTKLFYEEN